MENSFIFTLAKKIRPEINTLPPDMSRVQAIVEAGGTLVLIPSTLVGVVWLVLRTDWAFMFDNMISLLVLLLLLLLMNQQPFTINLKLGKDDTTIAVTSSLGTLVFWISILIFGVHAVWLQLAFSLIMPIRAGWRNSRFTDKYFWSPFFSGIQNMGGILGSMVAIGCYETIGGDFPLGSVEFVEWIPAFMAILVDVILGTILTLPIILILNQLLNIPNTLQNTRRTFLSMTALGIATSPFAILGSLLYVRFNFGVLCYFLIGLFLVNLLANFLSRANAKSEQRARELSHLERLGEDIIQAPADASTLRTILEEHLGKMFPQERVGIRLFPPQDSTEKLIWPVFDLIIRERPSQLDSVWDQLKASQDNHIVLKDVIPEGMKAGLGDAIIAKIMVGDEGQATPAVCRGGVYLLRNKTVGQTIDSLSAIQTLASQIGSALYRAEVFAETLELQKAAQELEFAGHIQSSFLPSAIPEISGWDIAATLIPARQTSGDFYDFVPLENGNIGILVADVADKGTGAALYMALSRTLIRTYAMQYPDNPEEALRAANERILSDTKSDQFVTVFYAILKPESGELIYANAGHNPAMVVGKNEETQLLTKTGVPLGMFDGLKWKQNAVQLSQGDILILYTDGASEAQNEDDDEFGEDRIIDCATEHLGNTADDVQEAIIEGIHHFVGDAPQFDDITLMVAVHL